MKLAYFIFLVLLVSLQACSPCFYKKSKVAMVPTYWGTGWAEVEYECLNKDELEVMTSERLLWENVLTEEFLTSFVKAGNIYYLRIHFVRRLSNSFDINEDNAIIFQLDNEDVIKLYPVCNFKGYRPVLSTSYGIFAFYKVSKEQIEKFAANRVVFNKLYFTSENTFKTALKDDEGTFWDKEVKVKRFQKLFFMTSAKCILKK